MGGDRVKTTIYVNEDLWNEFSIRVIRERGHRKKNEVIEELIEDYVKEKSSEKT